MNLDHSSPLNEYPLYAIIHGMFRWDLHNIISYIVCMSLYMSLVYPLYVMLSINIHYINKFYGYEFTYF